MPSSTAAYRRSLLEAETIIEPFPAQERGAPAIFVGYPSTYRVGMSNLGFQYVHRTLRREGALRVERFFADTAPSTLESGAGLGGAAALLVSVSYEEDYLGLVRMLLGAGIAPLGAERERGPAVVVGGPAVSANPFALSAVADALVLGEGETAIGPLAAALRAGGSRGDLLGSLAAIPSILVPEARHADAVFGRACDLSDFPHTSILSRATVFPETLLMEFSRGCPGSCSFCLARVLYHPYRAVGPEAIEACLDALIAPVGRVGLVSTAVAAHPDFTEIVELLLGRGMSVSFGSIRAEDLTVEKARLFGRAGVRSVSLAPEAGDERRRGMLGKRVPDEVYLRAAGWLREAGVQSFSLYLLVGLPGENAAASIRDGDFCRRFAAAAGGARVTVHANVLVPKAWTPLQFFGMPAARVLERRLDELRRECRSAGIGFRAKSVRSARRQAILSLGGEGVGRALVRYARRGISWRKALEGEGIDEMEVHRERGADHEFPWDRIGGPVGREYLYGRYRSMADGGREGA